MSKERPIIFSAPMVRAILEGRKTQTRRIVKRTDSGRVKEPGSHRNFHIDDRDAVTACPYGVIGDRLWVRETWAHDAESLEQCRATHEDISGGIGYGPYYRATECAPDTLHWRPSIHMPRWTSRITLEIVGVRVERLQEISATDILSEGAVNRPHVDQFGRNPVSEFDGKVYMDLRSLWAHGWDSINAKRAPWSSNPWVWVIEFQTR